MDTFPRSEDEVAKQETELKDYAGGLAASPQPSPVEPPKPKIDESVNTTLLNPGPNMADRSYKGFGALTAYPTELDVQKLRQNQNDPDMLKLFDSMYGAGSSKRYLSYPSVKDVAKLLENKNDPEFVKLFDRTYGDLSKILVPLYDPRTSAEEKQLLAARLQMNLEHGKTWVDSLADNSFSEAIGSVEHGVKAGAYELGRAGASAVDWAAGTDWANNIPSTADTRLTNHPIVNGLIEGVTQFITGRLALAPVGAIKTGADLGKLGVAIREMSLGSLVNAMAFNPNDPLLGDLAKHLGMGENWFTKLDSIDTYKSELTKRAARAGEGAAIGLAIDALSSAYRAVKAYRAGDVKAAEAAKNELADNLEHFDNGMADAKQGELPLGNMNDKDAAFEVRTRRAEAEGKLGVPETATQPSLMDLPFERRLDQLPESIIPRVRPQETLEEMQYRLMDKWGVTHQLSLDLGKPKEGPFVHGREPGQQGELFQDLPRPPKPGEKVEAPAQGDLFDHPPPTAEGTPKGYSKAEVMATTREQFIKDVINDEKPVVREVKASIEGERRPTAVIPQSVRDVLDHIEDFRDFSLDGIRKAVSPVLNDFLKIAHTTPEEIERVLASEIDPKDVQKLQALTSIAVAKAERAAAEAGAKLDAFKKAKVTNAAEIDALSKEVKDANSFLSDLQKVDFPLSTYAGRLLQQRQIEARITAANRVNIAQLRKAGVSDERINQMIRTAMDMTGSDNLSYLNHERQIAFAKGDAKRVTEIDEEIAKELDRVEKRANSQVKTLTNQIAKDVASYTISNILSGLGTVIRNTIGIFGHLGVYRVNQWVGMMDRFGMIEGSKAYWMQSKARNLALRYGHQSHLQMLKDIFKDAAVDAFHGERKTAVNPMGGLEHRIRAENYGIEDTKFGKALNAFGRGSELLTWPLRMSDEVASDIIGRHAIGTRAAFNFFDNLHAQREVLEAKLRDPKLTASERKAFEAELETYKGKNPTVEIDGKKVTLREHVESQVQQAYDKTGHLVDPNAIDETNYILLRNRQTPSAFGQAIEKAVNSTPYIRFLVPVFNAPMNGFKRGFEMVPGLRRMGLTDLKAELESTDPYVRALARGKLHVGYGVIGTALLLADQGLITIEPVNSRAPRLSAQASSSPGPFQLKIAGTSWDISGLDPVTVPLVWAAVFMDSLKKYIAAYDQNVAIQDQKGVPIPVLEQRLHRLLDIGLAIGGATGQAVMQNPAVSGLKDVVDLLTSIDKLSDEEGTFWKEGAKMARGQLGKLVPNAYKQMLGLFDNKRYDPATISDVLDAAAGMTSNAPMLYDITGKPMVNKSPARSLLGPLAAVNPPNKNDKGQYVIDTLNNWGEITGHYYTFDTTPPDAVLKRYGVDLRTIDSVAGNRKVIDEFAKNYRELSIRGQTVDEALYGVVTHAVKTDMAIGNKLQRNADLWGTIDKVVKEYKDIAWEMTLRKEMERKNSPLYKQVHSAYALKEASRDPTLDRPDEDGIQTRTREMLRMFPH